MARTTACSLLLILLCGLFSQGLGQSGKGAVFVYQPDSADDGNSQLVFALDAGDSGSFDFHIEYPPGNQWTAFGIGDQMKGALIFMVYEDADGRPTLSPRIADGHSEPTYLDQGPGERNNDSTLVITSLKFGSLPNGLSYTDGSCNKCLSWPGGSLDLTNKQQPFIFAIGPPGIPAPQSTHENGNNRDASIQRHQFYGHFTMDMTQATSNDSAEVPAPNGDNNTYVSFAASSAQDTKEDHDYGSRAHGLVMCVAFVLIMPLGALILRVFNKVLVHAGVMAFALLLVIIGFGNGVRISMLYNKVCFLS